MSRVWKESGTKGQLMAVNQKGANGIIAEYQSAVTVVDLLVANQWNVHNDRDHLIGLRDATVQRVGNELTDEQVERALRQGTALGEYLFASLSQTPEILGLEQGVQEIRSSTLEVHPVGHATNSGDPRDLTIIFRHGDTASELAVSLKAYASDSSSLGSKSGRATLARLFFGKEKITDQEFLGAFGESAAAYNKVLADFKRAAKDFYQSDDAEEFLAAYEARKGHRKVNNPLRRKEVGQYFLKQYGFVSEHRLAALYAEMHNFGTSQILDTQAKKEQFVESLKFILGNPQMLVLDAKTSPDGSVREVMNSLTNPVYRKLNQMLRPGLDLELVSKNLSSDITVNLSRENERLQGLSLAMWKDGTIQYKLNSAAM